MNEWRPPLTTGQAAEQLNQAIRSRVYDDRAMRAEVDAGRLRAFVAPRERRRRIRITEAALLEWAAGVLNESELGALRAGLQSATGEEARPA